MPEEEGVGKKILNTLFGAWGPGEGATFVQEPGIGMLPSSFQWGDWLKGSYDKIKRGDVAGGISQGLRTLGQTAAPFALPAALYRAPLAAPLGMVGSSILSSETEQRLKAAGVEDGRAALAGDIAGMLVGVPGSKKPTLHARINARNTLHRSVEPKLAVKYLDEGELGFHPESTRAARSESRGLPSSTEFISTSRVPRSSDTGDWITFELDPAKVGKTMSWQGLSQQAKQEGKFEFETAAFKKPGETRPGIPLDAVKVIRINTDRLKTAEPYPAYVAQYNRRRAEIKAKAAAYGIPVIEGTTQEHLLSRIKDKQPPQISYERQLEKQTLNQKINNRNSVYRSTDPVAALTYLDEGVINPGPMAIRRARAKNLNLPDDTKFISTSRAPRSSSHMDWVTFEIDAAKMPPKSTPLQGLPSWHKPKGNFEFETAATQPIPLEAVKVIRINTDRPKFVSDVPYLQQQYVQQVTALKKKATAYGIPVVEGSTKDHMMSRLTGK